MTCNEAGVGGGEEEGGATRNCTGTPTGRGRGGGVWWVRYGMNAVYGLYAMCGMYGWD